MMNSIVRVYLEFDFEAGAGVSTWASILEFESDINTVKKQEKSGRNTTKANNDYFQLQTLEHILNMLTKPGQLVCYIAGSSVYLREGVKRKVREPKEISLPSDEGMLWEKLHKKIQGIKLAEFLWELPSSKIDVRERLHELIAEEKNKKLTQQPRIPAKGKAVTTESVSTTQNSDVQALTETRAQLLKEIEEYRKTKDSLHLDIQACNKEITRLQSDLQKENESLLKQKEEIEKQNAALQTLVERRTDEEAALRKISKTKKQAQEQIALLNAQGQNLKSRLIDEERATTNLAKVAALEEQLAEKNARIQYLQNQLTQTESQLRTTSNKQTLSKLPDFIG